MSLYASLLTEQKFESVFDTRTDTIIDIVTLLTYAALHIAFFRPPLTGEDKFLLIGSAIAAFQYVLLVGTEYTFRKRIKQYRAETDIAFPIDLTEMENNYHLHNKYMLTLVGTVVGLTIVAALLGIYPLVGVIPMLFLTTGYVRLARYAQVLYTLGWLSKNHDID